MPRVLLVVLMLSLSTACGGDPGLPAISDSSTCEEVQQVVDEAVGLARMYIGTEDDDPLRADDLVFSLSAVDERPECVDEGLADTARGLRLTIVSTS